ncbi:MAG: hypothetical protein EBU43_07350 [Actinobacteria bacterium]|jgi:hypothetical protein|nr:hypothetical protein [Actinomycetota bacterium]NBP92134.1 hypothetical protein [Actinomycetota bacterium]
MENEPADLTLDFSLERARALTPDLESEAYLLEISWLYDRIVRAGSLTPVLDLSLELVQPFDFVADCVSSAMHHRYLKSPARGSNGGEISQLALRKLKLLGKHRV